MFRYNSGVWIQEESHSGQLHMLGKHEPERVTRVRISPPPQRKSRRAGQRCWDVYIRFANVLRHRLPMFYYTYILQSLKDNSLYIGYTSDLKKRFKAHNEGKSVSTKPFRPYELIFYEAFLNRMDAKKREIYLKSGWGLKSIKKMLDKYFTSGSGRAFLKKHRIMG